MKIVVIIGLLFLGKTMFAQNETTTIQPFKLTEIVHTDSVNASELYERARLWFAQTFNNSKVVLQISDKETGELVGKAKMKYNSSIFIGSAVTSGWISYTIKVNVKDGRYKYEVSDFIHEGTSTLATPPKDFGLITVDKECPIHAGKALESQEWRNKVWADIRQTIREELLALLPSLKTAMLKPSSKVENW